MTLILTALCKNGICVCSDRRNITWTGGALKSIDDNLNKQHKFKDISLIIFNHGVNKFGKKSWRDLCLDYESSNRWRDKDLASISEDFKDFIEDDVVRQLKQNIRIMPNLNNIRQAGFALCGKDPHNNNFEFHELYWSPEFVSNSWKDTRLIVSGVGYKKYLDKYLLNAGQSNSVEFWGKTNIMQAKKKLEILFSIAVAEKKQLAGDEFSDDFDIECIPE